MTKDPDRAASALNRRSIAAAALALIDANGLARFSMRRLGGVLGVDPMAVYRYFDGQESLFDGVAEAVFDELDVDSLRWDAGWRGLVEQYCLRLRDVLLRHPHAVTVFATRPVRSPASIDAGVRIVHKLRDSGFSPGRAVEAMRCLREFTVGHVLSIVAASTGTDDRSAKPEQGAPEYNLLAQGADETELGAHFESGLAAMLDGFAQPC